MKHFMMLVQNVYLLETQNHKLAYLQINEFAFDDSPMTKLFFDEGIRISK